MAFHDLTMPLDAATPIFPGDPVLRIDPWPDALPWQVSRIALGSHTGTHMDAPRHRFPGGATIDAFGPDRWVGEAVAIACGGGENERLLPGALASPEPALLRGRFALLATGWDRFAASDPARYFRHPFLSEALAIRLRDLSVALVGIDAPSIDSTADGGDAAHRILLGAGIPVVENLRGLDLLPLGRPVGAAFAPLALAQADGAPVRAFAWDLGG